MNRGDTAYLLLDYQVNGAPLIQGDYQEIELQINKQNPISSVKKLLSLEEITWESGYQYEEDGETKSFTGYVAHLTQEDTFKVNGTCSIQLRVMKDDEVGSSEITSIDLGAVLSRKVLEDGSTQG